MLYAKTGVGKTFVALMIAYAVALGDKFFLGMHQNLEKCFILMEKCLQQQCKID